MEQQLQLVNSVKPTVKKSESKDKSNEASYRISAFILTKAWLKRCQTINDLNANIAQCSVQCQASQAKLESKKYRYFSKQHENEELTCQLRLSQKQMEELLLSIDELALNVETLEAKKNELLLQFSARCEECIDTNMQISDLKLQLMQVLEKNEELETLIETEKMRAERVSREGNKLNDELNKIRERCAENENKLTKRIEAVEKEIQRTKNEKKELKRKLEEMKRFNEEYEKRKSTISGTSIELEKMLLCQQAAALREALEHTIENKLRKHGITVISIILAACKIILPAFSITNQNLFK